MSSYTVNVKWGKEKFTNVVINTAEPPELFQAQLFALSGVPIERQKVMGKGKTLKSESWEGFALKNGMTLLMMGSADQLPVAPETKTSFIEDMTESQINKAVALPAGLQNLGNTCYMNATIQCLRNIPELKQGLETVTGGLNLNSIQTDPSHAVALSFRDLNRMMNKGSQAIPPIMFLQIMHSVFPQFAEKSEQGGFQQQDANECWTQLVRMLQQQIKSPTPSNSLIDQYFGISLKSTLKCDESTDEQETSSEEKLYQLSCFISQDVKYLHTGLKLRLKETITKNSPSLGRDATYTKNSLVDRLPAYLTVQFVRFFFKEKEKVNAKILKDIKFPMTFDAHDLCSPELQEKLKPMRDKFKEEDDKRVAKKVEMKGEKPMETDQTDELKEKTLPYHFEDDLGSNNSGYYELTAVLTHRGRSSSSGHYVAWIRKKGDDWLMCDDDQVHPVTSQDILKLSGGGDWHCAYLLVYAPKSLAVESE